MFLLTHRDRERVWTLDFEALKERGVLQRSTTIIGPVKSRVEDEGCLCRALEFADSLWRVQLVGVVPLVQAIWRVEVCQMVEKHLMADPWWATELAATGQSITDHAAEVGLG
jgi:hypothetical protein